MKKFLALITFIATSFAIQTASAVSFDFKDPKGVNAISFLLDSLLEPISGTASGVSGMIDFDPAAPAKLTGKIVVDTASLTVANNKMQEHLLSDGWLNAATNPEIIFEIKSLNSIESDGNTTTAIAQGSFTLKGVTKNISVPLKITHLAGAFGKRMNKPDLGGDLLVVRGKFSITRTDYGIRPGQNEDKVADEIELSLALVGSAPQA
jgi:polyisoprenoid-binding protein YceI